MTAGSCWVLQMHTLWGGGTFEDLQRAVGGQERSVDTDTSIADNRRVDGQESSRGLK